jgi:hypothetical protein
MYLTGAYITPTNQFKMTTPTKTYEDFAIEMVESYRCCAFSEDAKECAIIECERHILYAEDKEYFREVLKFLNNM